MQQYFLNLNNLTCQGSGIHTIQSWLVWIWVNRSNTSSKILRNYFKIKIPYVKNLHLRFDFDFITYVSLTNLNLICFQTYMLNKVGNKIQQWELETDYHTLALWCYFRWNCPLSFYHLTREVIEDLFTGK